MYNWEFSLSDSYGISDSNPSKFCSNIYQSQCSQLQPTAVWEPVSTTPSACNCFTGMFSFLGNTYLGMSLQLLIIEDSKWKYTYIVIKTCLWLNPQELIFFDHCPYIIILSCILVTRHKHVLLFLFFFLSFLSSSFKSWTVSKLASKSMFIFPSCQL